MSPISRRVLTDFQVRKSRSQKEAFRAWLCKELEAAGYTPHVENGFAAKNVVAGGPETAKVLFSAHYDTCAVLPFPNFITPRNLFFYLCYQLMLVVPLFLVVAVAVVVAAAAVLSFSPVKYNFSPGRWLLLHKHEDLSSNSQSPCKKLGVATHMCL